jgi:TolB-like protein/Tfp pilus assembly protein PilF
MGRFDEAIREINLALELDPLSLQWNVIAVSILSYAGKLEKAEEVLQKVMELNPGHRGPHAFLAMAYLRENMYEKAIEAFEKEKMIGGGSDVAMETAIGCANAFIDQPNEARKVLNDLLEQSKSGYIAPSLVGRLYLVLGEHDLGFEWLEKAYEERDLYLLTLKVDPGFEILGLDSDPRYIALLRKMNLETRSPAITESKAPEEKTYTSIAVLPFADMSPDKDQEYFCDGMSEELINALAQFENLRVIARTSAFSFKGQNIDVREIGNRLNVEAVLEGSVRKAGNQLRITAQLVDAATNDHLWSKKYDRKMEDIFAIQDEITLAIVSELKGKLLGSEKARLTRNYEVNTEVYNLYLRGMFNVNKLTPEGMQKGEAYFKQALEKDPDFAPVYAELAYLYNLLSLVAFLPPEETYSKAREAALKALEIDDTLADAHSALAQSKMYYGWDWEGAKKEYMRAIELSPSDAGLRSGYAYYLMYNARFDEAINEIDIAINHDPLSPDRNFTAGLIYYFAGRYDESIEFFKNGVLMAPDYPYAHIYLGRAYARKSMYEEALAEIQKENNINPGREALTGIVYMEMGRKDEAQRLLDWLTEHAKEAYVPPTSMAWPYFTLGENDKGFLWLDKAYEARDPWLSFIKIDPAYDNIRSDPRFIALLKKIGLDK